MCHLPDDVDQVLQEIGTKSPLLEKMKFNVTPVERDNIERITRCQSQSPEWFAVRARRITGSKCGKIICQKEGTLALLKSVMYSKPMESNCLPKSIKWGNDNEPCARAAYTQYMRSNGHANLVTRPCGFIVHPSMGWLGASPDAVVTDPSVELQHGIAEFKCPYTKKGYSTRRSLHRY